MDLWRSLSGMVDVELVSADPAGSMREINTVNIPIFDLVWMDDLTIRFRLRRMDHRKLRKLTQKRGERLHLIEKKGTYWQLKQLLRRPVLMGGILLIAFLSLWLPTRILFIQVEGNSTIPVRRILEQAQNCGIQFGASRRDVRSEKMKNSLLEAIPELQWAGINTSGCTAMISVRERTIPVDERSPGGVSSIVAAADGVISEMTVTKGNPLCKVGQAVKAGQVLVSGYTDCGICVRAEQAQAEIFAETNRIVTAVTPSEYVEKGGVIRSEKKISLIIGKKQINFCKGSGISDSTCDKMYSETYMLLPGGFQLPAALVTEQWIWREETPRQIDEAVAGGLLTNLAGSYLSEQMVAGQIRQRYETLSADAGVFRLYGKYTCREMICKTRIEEKLPDYAEAD